MKHLANGRWAAIVAAGIVAFCASTAQAGLFSFGTDAAQTEAAAAPPPPQPEAKEPVRRSRQVRHRRHKTERSAKVRKDEAVKTAEKAPAKPDAKPAEAPMPPAVADAHAQMLPAAAANGAAVATTTAAPEPSAPAASEAAPAPEAMADTAAAAPQGDIVASDELNDLDRAAAEKPAQKVLRPVSSSVQSASAQDEDVWGRTSLIGKIFIAFGSMLTLASAARMFIA